MTTIASNETLEIPAVRTKPFRSRLRYLLTVIFVLPMEIYGFSLSLLLLVHVLTVLVMQYEAWWPTTMMINLMPGILVPALFIVVVGLLMRRKRLIAATLLPVMALVILYGDLFIPRAAAVESDAVQFTIMTFNTHTEDGTLPQMAALIREANADIVALQELNENTADYFKSELADDYPYQSSRTYGASVRGKGLLSKYPMGDVEWSDPERPIYQRVPITIQGQTVIVYNAHLFPPAWGVHFDATGRRQTAEIVITRAIQDAGPVVIVGDMNTSDQTADYHLFTAHYTDTHREVGMGLSPSFPDFGAFPFPFSMISPIIRIDYVFHNEGLAGVWGGIWPNSAASDHRPYVARLALNH